MISSHHHWQLNETDHTLIALALKEDLNIPYQDLTTDFLFKQKEHTLTTTYLISKEQQPFIFCGLQVLDATIEKLDRHIQYTAYFEDGEVIQPGQTIIKFEGRNNVLLMAERVILNFLQRLSGIATITDEYVKLIKDNQTTILDTRKTTPGWRHLEKYAVYCGGGANHRMGLYDAMMIKDTHIDMAGGIDAVLNTLPLLTEHHYPVILEIEDPAQLPTVLTHGLTKISRILLDNMSLDDINLSVQQCSGKIATEASGNINKHNVYDIAKTGVNFVSIGSITHSAPNIDLSMKAAQVN